MGWIIAMADLAGEDNRLADASGASVGGGLYPGVLLGFFLVYALTTQSGPAWQDSGIFQWRILQFDLTGWFGIALAHPLLILLGKAFSHLPSGDPAWRMNLVSAACGALAAANIAALVRRLAPRQPEAAWIAAGLFGLAHTPWWLSTICESQMVVAALFTAELNVLLALIRRPRPHLVLLLGGLNGLAATAHNLALLAAPVYGLVVLALCLRRHLRWSALPLLPAGWAVGAAGLLVLVGDLAGRAGLAEAVRSALFGQSWQSHVLGGSPRAVGLGVGYILYNFPNAGLPLAAAGLAALGRQAAALRRALVALAGIYLLFAVRYAVPDQFMFFGPFYVMVAVLAGLGYGRLAAGRAGAWVRAAALAGLLIGPGLYAAAPLAARRFGLTLPGRKDLPFRDHARYWLSPWKHSEDSAGRFARAALDECPPGAIILTDGTTHCPLIWTQRLGRGSDPGGPRILLRAAKDSVPIGRPDVFVVSPLRGYHPAWLDEAASFRKDHEDAVLYRVVWREGSGGAAGPGAVMRPGQG